jgi:hypothetical protein
MKPLDLLGYLMLATVVALLLCVDYLNRWNNTPERMRPTIWRHVINYTR